MGFCALVYFNAALYQIREDREFERTLKLAVPPSPHAPSILPATRLEIPRLALSVMVVEGVQTDSLRKGAGHIPGTALPDETGNIGIAAHRDTYFRKLRNIQPKDEITLTTLKGSYQYAVDWTHCQPNRRRRARRVAPTGSHAGDLLSVLLPGFRTATLHCAGA